MRAPKVTFSEFTELLSLSLNWKPEEKLLFFPPLPNSLYRKVTGMTNWGEEGCPETWQALHILELLVGWQKVSALWTAVMPRGVWWLMVSPRSASPVGFSDNEEGNKMCNNSKAAQPLFQDLFGHLGFRAVNVTWHVKSDMINTVKEPSIPTVQMDGR